MNDSSEAGALHPVPGGEIHNPAAQDCRPPTHATSSRTGVPYDCRFVPYGAVQLRSGNVERTTNPYMTYATFVDSLAPTTQRYRSSPRSFRPIQQLDQWGVSANVNWKINENIRVDMDKLLA